MLGEGGPQAGGPESALLAQYAALLQAVRTPPAPTAGAGAAAVAPSSPLPASTPVLPAAQHPLSSLLASRQVRLRAHPDQVLT